MGSSFLAYSWTAFARAELGVVRAEIGNGGAGVVAWDWARRADCRVVSWTRKMERRRMWKIITNLEGTAVHPYLAIA